MMNAQNTRKYIDAHYSMTIPTMSLDLKSYQDKARGEPAYILYVRGDVLQDTYKTALHNYERACFGISKQSAIPAQSAQGQCTVYDDYNVYLFTIKSSDNLVQLLNHVISTPGYYTNEQHMLFIQNQEHIPVPTQFETTVLEWVFNGLYIAHMKTALNYETRTINLFSVCIQDTSNRGKGYASVLLKSAKTRMDKTHFDKMWLGVLLNNPSFKCAVTLYAKNGFTVIQQERVCELNGEPYIQMEWNAQPNVQTELNRALEIRKSVGQYNEWCRQYVYMDPQMASCLQTYQRNPIVEYGGVLSIVPSKVKDDIHILVPSQLVRGESSTVDVPVSTINFHTHPESCYNTFGCDSGWPSAPDSYYILRNFNDILAHLVITREGFYIIKVNPDAQAIMKSITDNVKLAKLADYILATVYIYFAILENTRVVHATNVIPEDKIIDYLRQTDQVSLTTMVSHELKINHTDSEKETSYSFNDEKYINSVLDKSPFKENIDLVKFQEFIKNLKDLKDEKYGSLRNLKPFSIQFIYWKQLETQGGIVFDIFFPKNNGACQLKEDAPVAPDNSTCAEYKNVDMTEAVGGSRRLQHSRRTPPATKSKNTRGSKKN
jgi:hypothetical protein